MSVKESGKGLEDIQKALDFLKRNRCYVGIPGAGSSRVGDTPTNAELAFIHSQGSPRLNIPPRPFLEPAMAQAETQAKVLRHMKRCIIAAVDGDTAKAVSELHKVGIAGENAAKDYFGSGKHAPNAAFTLKGGWMRNRISGKRFKAKPKKSAVPLIDTGSLRSSITHVIEEG